MTVPGTSRRRAGRLLGVVPAVLLLVACGGNTPPPEPPPTSSPPGPTVPTAPTVPPPTTPAPVPPAEPVSRTLTVATFNALGSNHTAPGGSREELPSGVERTAGLVSRLDSYGPDIVGLQEFQRAQAIAVDRRVGAQYGRFGDLDNSILWRRSRFTVHSRTTLTIPYFAGRPRPMPVVRLRLTGTRTVITVLAVHNPASVHGDARAFRTAAVQVERAFVQRERARGRVVLLVGDLNDRDEVFCAFAAGGLMVAANGGSLADGVCTPPADPRIDWILGAGVTFSDYVWDTSTRDDEVSDHPFVVATATVGPGAAP